MLHFAHNRILILSPEFLQWSLTQNINDTDIHNNVWTSNENLFLAIGNSLCDNANTERRSCKAKVKD